MVADVDCGSQSYNAVVAMMQNNGGSQVLQCSWWREKKW